MKSYGINKSISITTKEEFHLEEFYHLGYTIIENVISEADLFSLRTELDNIYKIQEKDIGKENLKLINEENLVRIPLAYSELFVKLASRKEMMAYVKKILGDFFILHLQNGIINMPNEVHHQSSWHRDLPYQNWTSSEPLACNVYCCIDDFNYETGGTYVLPFSHHFNAAASNHYMEKNKVQVNAPAGSVILFNSMIFHKAGYNNSKNKIRRGINQMYVKPIISQQIDLPEFLNGKYADDEFLGMLFGYKTQLAKSVSEYRIKRMKRKNK
jgi:ectoine hydroxylase-related dioxygenase (phytanoyl-CoA dioxygenase family)